MRTIFLLSLLALPALAHVKLTLPANFQVTDALGSPNKSEPCGGAGTATGAVTTVMAGSQLTVSWTEPVFHPGHFRIGIARNPSDFVTPIPVLTNNNTNCSSAPIQSQVTYPTLVDGLFAQHTSGSGPFTTTVTVPMISCTNCRLQLMQFMSSHPPSCFYYQCATLNIVMPDAGQPMTDAGTGAGGGAGTGGGTATGGSGGSGACGASSCAGCCALDRCEPGNAETACGTGGSVCAACVGANACQSSECKPAAPGCGCSAAPLGVLAFALLSLLARRRS